MRKSKLMKLFFVWIAMVSLTLTTEAIAKEKPYEGVTITMLVTGHPATEAMKSVIPDFEKETGMRILLDEMDYTRLYDKAKMELSSPVSAYDTIMTDGVWIPEWAAKNLIIPLEPYLKDLELGTPTYDLEDVLYIDANLTYNGILYALSMSGETNLLFYRKDLFEKYGKEVPQTMKDLMAEAKFFHGREPRLHGISLRGKRGPEIYFGWAMLLFPFGGTVIDENNQPVINSAEAVESLKFYVELMKYAPLGQSSFSYDETVGAFIHGEAAMFIDATNIAYMENPDYSQIVGKIGWALPPSKEGKPSKTEACGWTLPIPANAKNKKAAFKFIQWLTNKENDKRMALVGGMPNRESAFMDPELVKKYAYYPAVLEALKHIDPTVFPRLPEWPDMQEYIGLAASEALLGTKSPKEALDWAQKKLEPILAHYRK